jgi:DNA-binding transcriptional LysR family regulator
MPRIELRHLRSFIAVARHLHFSHAADELGMAPPALTKHIKEAEHLLGVRLFHRTQRSVALTAAGAAYLPQAQAVFDHLVQGSEAARLAERGELGHIEIGYVGSAVYAGILQSAVFSFNRDHPQVEVTIREHPMGAIAPMLLDGTLDVAYVRPPMPYPEGIQAATVYRDNFVVALPAHSPLAEFDVLKPKQLHDQLFVLPEQAFGTLEVARRGGFTPRLGPSPGSLIAVLSIVSLGQGIAVLPDTFTRCVSLAGVVCRPLAGKPVPSELALIFRRHERAPAVQLFLKHARTEHAAAASRVKHPT